MLVRWIGLGAIMALAWCAFFVWLVWRNAVGVPEPARSVAIADIANVVAVVALALVALWLLLGAIGFMFRSRRA